MIITIEREIKQISNEIIPKKTKTSKVKGHLTLEFYKYKIGGLAYLT